MTFVLLKPEGRRRSWRVEARVRGELHWLWVCDSEDIALEVFKRLKKNKAPGWIAHDLRHSQGRKP